MNSNRFFLCLLGLACALGVSCADDPMTTSGTHVAPGYEASLEGLNAGFTSICGTSASDVYAVGAVILHFDGIKWSPVDLPVTRGHRLRNAVSFGNGQLMVSTDEYVFRRKDNQWTRHALPGGVNDLWGSAPDDAYATSFEGDMFHFDGTAWSNGGLPPADNLISVSGNASGDVAFVGAYGAVVRKQDDIWTTTYVDSHATYRDVALTGSGRTFVSEYNSINEIDGSTEIPILDNVWDIVLCTDEESLYAAGRGPGFSDIVLKRYEDGIWSDIPIEVLAYDLFAHDRTLFASSTRGGVWRGGAGGGEVMVPYPSQGEIHDAVSIDGVVYTIGSGAYRYQDGMWTNLDKEYITPVISYALDGRRKDNVYAVGPQMVIHYDGVKWNWVNAALNAELYGVWTAANGDVVAVGRDGVIVEFDGSKWTSSTLPGSHQALQDVCGFGERVFAVGNDGLIAMRIQGEWIITPSPTSEHLWGVWGLNENQVYALSSDPTEICVYNGRSWQPMSTMGVDLVGNRCIWGTSRSNLFILDYSGTLAHFDGQEWSAETRLLNEGMRAVCPVGNRDLLALGLYGAVSYRR